MVWSGKLSQRWVVVVPEAPGGIQWQQLWAAYSLLKDATTRTTIYLLLDRTLSPTSATRVLGPLKQRVKISSERIFMDAESIKQATHHLWRSGATVLSPIKLDWENTEHAGTTTRPGTFNQWTILPAVRDGQACVSMDSSLNDWIKTISSYHVILAGEEFPELVNIIYQKRVVSYVKECD